MARYLAFLIFHIYWTCAISLTPPGSDDRTVVLRYDENLSAPLSEEGDSLGSGEAFHNYNYPEVNGHRYIDEMPQLIHAVIARQPDVVQNLLAGGHDPNVIYLGKSALEHCLEESRCIDCAKVIVSHEGVNMEAADLSAGHYAPLTTAIYDSHFDLATLMLEKGASAIGNENEEFSALHAAVWRNKEDLVKMLVTGGADVQMQSNSGRNTPIFDAATRGKFRLFDIMMTSSTAESVNAEHLLSIVHRLDEYRAYQLEASILERNQE